MSMTKSVRFIKLALALFFITLTSSPLMAEIDGHGPDAWRVTGVAANDRLNARMGPGTNYPVIEKFAHNERGMQQITCVPYYTLAHYSEMSQAEINALPPRWCLMRNASLTKAGWVAQRFITPDDTVAAPAPGTSQSAMTAPATRPQPRPASSGDALIDQAVQIVHDIYDAQARAERGQGPDPFEGRSARRYFTDDIVTLIRSNAIGAHPLYGAQDFDGYIINIAPDPDTPMFRGMITVNVDFINFGQNQRAVFFLRADTTQQNAPLRIFRVEHDGWSYP